MFFPCFFLFLLSGLYSIGVTDMDVEGTYRMPHNGQTVLYPIPWQTGSGEPDGGAADCICINSELKTWLDFGCSVRKFFFICEY